VPSQATPVLAACRDYCFVTLAMQSVLPCNIPYLKISTENVLPRTRHADNTKKSSCASRSAVCPYGCVTICWRAGSARPDLTRSCDCDAYVRSVRATEMTALPRSLSLVHPLSRHASKSGSAAEPLVAEPWLSGCQVLSGDLSGCRAAVRHCQVPLSDQLSGAVSAVGCCRVRV